MDKLVKSVQKVKAVGISGVTNPHLTRGVKHTFGSTAGPERANIKLVKTRLIDLDRARLRNKHIYIDAEDRESAVAISAYRNLRTQVLKTMSALSIRSLIVTGPTRGVGKTVTAINLAINIARHERRTALLVDLDLRDPSVHNCLGFTPESGIVDVACGANTLEETLVTPGVERLTILPGTTRHEGSSELLLSASMQAIIGEVKDRYEERIVIFDAPPILGCDDVAAIAPTMDACLLVLDEGKTSRNELQEALARIKNLHIVGIVLNKSKEMNSYRYYY